MKGVLSAQHPWISQLQCDWHNPSQVVTMCLLILNSLWTIYGMNPYLGILKNIRSIIRCVQPIQTQLYRSLYRAFAHKRPVTGLLIKDFAGFWKESIPRAPPRMILSFISVIHCFAFNTSCKALWSRTIFHFHHSSSMSPLPNLWGYTPNGCQVIKHGICR
jgi:hypothetical protein